MESTNRQIYTTLLTLMLVIGAILFLFPFAVSLYPSNNEQTKESAPLIINLTGLEVGDIVERRWNGKPILVYRRNNKDVSQLYTINDLVSDPYSLIDKDPAYVKRIFRSIKPEYFVAVGLSTHCGCKLKYINSSNERGLQGFPGGIFIDICHIAAYDIAGRIITETSMPLNHPQLSKHVSNLRIPPHYFSDDDEIVIGETNEQT